MKRLWFGMFCGVLCLALVATAQEGGDKQPEKNQEKSKQEDQDKTKQDKDKDKDKKKEKSKPRDIIGVVELKDGSTITFQFLTKKMALNTEDLGLIAIPFDRIRFVDMEAKDNRVSTFGRDVYVGKIEMEQFRVKLVINDLEVDLKLDRIKRMNFPDPPEKQTELLFEDILPKGEKEKEKEKDKNKEKEKDKDKDKENDKD